MSTREWKPGDVAMVRYIDGGVEPSMLTYRHGWVSMVDGRGDGRDEPVTPLRPLVIIDAEDREQVERLTKAYHERRRQITDDTASDMQAALREFANPTPPKPEEPTGLGAVVCYDGSPWVGLGHGRWLEVPEDRRVEPRRRLWSEFHADVRVLSEGVTQ
jgi:hypothetical protein